MRKKNKKIYRKEKEINDDETQRNLIKQLITNRQKPKKKKEKRGKFNFDSEKGMMNWGKTNRNREERQKIKGKRK